jgi:hypothetical protein
MPLNFLIDSLVTGGPSLLQRRFWVERMRLENPIIFCLDAGSPDETVELGAAGEVVPSTEMTVTQSERNK